MTLKTFDEQRLERLQDTLSEYLDDDTGTATKFLDDLQVALIKNKQYFDGRVDEYNQVMEFFQ